MASVLVPVLASQIPPRYRRQCLKRRLRRQCRMLKWRRQRTNRTVIRNPSAPKIARRTSLKAIAGAFAGLIAPRDANAEGMPFEQWIVAFRAKAMARGITEETYTRHARGSSRHDRA